MFKILKIIITGMIFSQFLYSEVEIKSCSLTNIMENTKVDYVSAKYDYKTSNYTFKIFDELVKESNIVVNRPKQSVVVVLSTDEPMIWKIKWTKNTHIVAVVVSSKQQYALLGLDKNVPVLYVNDTKKDCHYFNAYKNEGVKYYIAQRAVKKITSKNFGKIINKAINNTYYIGEKVTDDSLLFSSDDYHLTQTTFQSIKKPTCGHELDGLIDAHKIRIARDEDLNKWNQMAEEKQRTRHRLPKSIKHTPLFLKPIVILDKLTLPEGLSGACAKEIIVPKEVPFPTGNYGHCIFYLMKDGSCYGHLCAKSLPWKGSD